MKTLFYIIYLFNICIATQWQPPETIEGLNINSLNLNSNNSIMYGSVWRDGYWKSDICYYNWNGNNWVFTGWIQGNVNTTDYEEEPFITYDGQYLYFQR